MGSSTTPGLPLPMPLLIARMKEGAAMTGAREIVLDRTLRGRVDRYEANFPALALNAEMQNTLPALHVFYPQPAQLFAPDTMVGVTPPFVKNCTLRTENTRRTRMNPEFTGMKMKRGSI
jgi:hypothetical protein